MIVNSVKDAFTLSYCSILCGISVLLPYLEWNSEHLTSLYRPLISFVLGLFFSKSFNSILWHVFASSVTARQYHDSSDSYFLLSFNFRGVWVVISDSNESHKFLYASKRSWAICANLKNLNPSWNLSTSNFEISPEVALPLDMALSVNFMEYPSFVSFQYR